ncbi:MAG TPA: hypothetical protein PLC42_02750 [Parachlamydiaceae bacterium]|nr:hypothetical protein [Parachlamydiaceae bacterium]
MSHFLYYLGSFIVGIFSICLGFLCFFVPSSEERLEKLTLFITQNPWFSYVFGIFFLTVGIAILMNVRLGAKKQYYRIKAGNRVTILDEKIFEQYLNTYWKELFPKNEVLSRASIKKNKLHITADLPHVPILEQKELLKQIESDLNDILIKYLGYHQEYILSVSFHPEN